MSERGRSTLPTPLGERLEVKTDAAHHDALWARIAARRRPRALDGHAALPLPLDHALVDASDDPASRLKHWRAIQSRRGVRGAPARPKWWLGGALASGILAVAAVLMSLFAPPAPPARGALLLAGGAALAPVEATQRELTLELTDASKIHLAQGARLVPLRSTASRVDLVLDRGSALFSVTPGGPRRWSVAAGEVRVEVVGTEFRVSRSGSNVEVTVTHGIVLVSGKTVPGGAQRLVAGDHLRVESSSSPEPSTRADASSSAPAASSVPLGAAPAPSSGEPAEHADAPNETSPLDDATRGAPQGRSRRRVTTHTSAQTSTSSAATWRQELAEGRYDAAYRALGQTRFAQATLAATSAEELLDLADVARLSGHAREALVPLTHLLDTFPQSPHAAVAAFTLGRTLLDQMHDATGAAEAFKRAINLHPPHALLEDCHARLVQALARAGARAEAERAAASYRVLFPNGRYVAELERWRQRE